MYTHLLNAPPAFVDLTRTPSAQDTIITGFVALHGREIKRNATPGQWVISGWLEEVARVFPLLSHVTKLLEKTGWQVGLYDRAEHADIDIASRTILVPSYGYDWERLSRHGLFGTLAQLELLKALRMAWQAEKGLLPDHIGLAPPDWLQLARARAADADLFMLLACYASRHMNTDKNSESPLWRYALAGDLYPVAEHLSRQLAIRPGKAGLARALQSSFMLWHEQTELVTPIDRAALDMIDALAEEVTLPTGRLTSEVLMALSSLGADFHYLENVADDVLRAPACHNIPDLVAQTHMLQIIEEQNLLAIGPVVLRDAELARRLFPDQ